MNVFGHPAQILLGLDDALAAGQATQRDRISGQTSLFDMGSEDAAALEAPLPQTPETPVRERLRWEKELMGLYLSDHPMGEVAERVGLFVTAYSGDLKDESLDGQRVVIGGIVTGIRSVITKARSTMAVVTLEDLQGTLEVVVFPKTYEQTIGTWRDGAILLVAGRVDHRGDEASLLADSVWDWDEVADRGPEAFAREVGSLDKRGGAAAVPGGGPSGGFRNGNGGGGGYGNGANGGSTPRPAGRGRDRARPRYGAGDGRRVPRFRVAAADRARGADLRPTRSRRTWRRSPRPPAARSPRSRRCPTRLAGSRRRLPRRRPSPWRRRRPPSSTSGSPGRPAPTGSSRRCRRSRACSASGREGRRSSSTCPRRVAPRCRWSSRAALPTTPSSSAEVRRRIGDGVVDLHLA